MKTVKISNDDFLTLDSKEFFLKQNQQYKVLTSVSAKAGTLYSSYVCVIILDENNREIDRHIRWIKDFSGKREDYKIIFTTKSGAKKAVISYRFNIETPVKGIFDGELAEPDSIKIVETTNAKNLYDDITVYKIPRFNPLTKEEEDLLERKIVWMMGSSRSGTTWLASQLLNHPQNTIWYEPWISYHLSTPVSALLGDGVKKDEHFFDRLYDKQQNNGEYFFSLQHENNWKPAFRTFILNRTFSQVQTFKRNVIVKEPVGSQSSDILLECLPKSKLIFLLRDGRDVVDSRLDTHKEDSWAKWLNLVPITDDGVRKNMIRWYSILWDYTIRKIFSSYQNHNPNLRLLVKYEDLKNNTFDELKRIYDFLDIKVNDDELNKKIQAHDFKKIPASQKGSGKFYRAASPGKWKENFSKEEQDLMNSIMGKTLKKMEYEI